MIRRLTLPLAIVAVLLLLVAGPGTRLGLWDFRFGFTLLRYGAILGAVAAVVALVQFLMPTRRAAHWRSLVAAMALGGVTFLVPYRWLERARELPPIHDVSTDTADPPAFVAVLAERAGAPNPSEYRGAEVAAAQAEAYPDIQPLVVPSPPDAAFRQALEAAQGMGWAIVAADSVERRIEATATTPWFGFKDDVVIRVRHDNAGSRVDVRSVSRVGQSDVGANAARIREYLSRLR